MSALRTAVSIALACAQALAYAQAPADALSPRVAQIKSTATVRIGYRESAIPFSFAGSDGMPIGYSIDLCRAVVDTLAGDLGRKALGIEFVRVTAQDRIERVARGDVDFECGSTAITSSRLARVAFSPAIFVAATRLAVPRASTLREVGDLRGRRVAVVAGTSNEAVLRDFDRRRALGIAFVAARDYDELIALVAEGRADALAADEVLVRGALAARGAPADVRFTGVPLSPEPYGIAMPRGEPMLADAADRTLRELARSREIVWIYDRWFVRTLPGGGALDMPMSVELARVLDVLGLPNE